MDMASPAANAARAAGALATIQDRLNNSSRHGRFTGNGGTTSVSFPHGLGVTPAEVQITAGSAAAAAAGLFATADATNVTVTWAAATTSGTNNIVLNWIVRKTAYNPAGF